MSSCTMMGAENGYGGRWIDHCVEPYLFSECTGAHDLFSINNYFFKTIIVKIHNIIDYFFITFLHNAVLYLT